MRANIQQNKNQMQNGRVIWLQSCGSTNSEAQKLLESSDNLSAVAAYCQTSGRGQGSHVWTSAPGLNLTFTIILKPECLPASECSLISCVATLSVLDHLHSRRIDAGIKLPNDIWTQGKKICGLLIENRLEGKTIKASLVGCGLNVNQTLWPAELPNPVSMKELSGQTYRLETELDALLEAFSRRASLLQTPGGQRSLREDFEKMIILQEKHSI